MVLSFGPYPLSFNNEMLLKSKHHFFFLLVNISPEAAPHEPGMKNKVGNSTRRQHKLHVSPRRRQRRQFICVATAVLDGASRKRSMCEAGSAGVASSGHTSIYLYL